MRCFVFIVSILFLFSACEEGTYRMNAYEVHGLDVSHYQSDIDWDAIAGQSVHFAFMKATEGRTYVDSLYCRNWEETKRVGIKRGAYHFFRPSVEPLVQANNFIQEVELQEGDLPPVLDVEVLGNLTKIELIIAVRMWLRHAEINYGTKPILYTYQKFYNKYLAGNFDEYPIWIARYNSRNPTLADRTNWQFWQYGCKGRLKGIDGNVDFNVFKGTIQDLDKLCVPPKITYNKNHLASTSF